ncbi:MAG: BlaI/MecI/CopY family transcriptional regulator [Verrucomicrobia bacterium]|nr:BlaI/MecI/CopY family transcriptional regulator [Verrucomicrobiota bacterium]
MPEAPLPRPTDAELSILRVLWRCGPCTVRKVTEELEVETGYTTALKLLQIMHEKGLVVRDDSERTHVFSPALPAERTRRQLLDHLLDQAFGGSAHQLVQQALAGRRPSKSEIASLRQLLDSLERKSS